MNLGAISKPARIANFKEATTHSLDHLCSDSFRRFYITLRLTDYTAP